MFLNLLNFIEVNIEKYNFKFVFNLRKLYYSKYLIKVLNFIKVYLINLK